MNAKNEDERPMPLAPDKTGTDEFRLTGPEPDAAGDAGRPATMDVQAYIGRQLRAVYDDVVKQPIPDRFLALMKQLEEQGPAG